MELTKKELLYIIRKGLKANIANLIKDSKDYFKTTTILPKKLVVTALSTYPEVKTKGANIISSKKTYPISWAGINSTTKKGLIIDFNEWFEWKHSDWTPKELQAKYADYLNTPAFYEDGGAVVRRKRAEQFAKHASGGSVEGFVDLSDVVGSKIVVEETNSFGNPDKLKLMFNGKKVGQFYYNMRGYNQDFDLKNKEGVHYGFGGDKPKARQLSDFKKALKEGYVFLKFYDKYAKGGAIFTELDLQLQDLLDKKLKDKHSLIGRINIRNKEVIVTLNKGYQAYDAISLKSKKESIQSDALDMMKSVTNKSYKVIMVEEYAKGGNVGKKKIVKPKIVRTQFEEETFEYKKGGKIDSPKIIAIKLTPAAAINMKSKDGNTLVLSILTNIKSVTGIEASFEHDDNSILLHFPKGTSNKKVKVLTTYAKNTIGNKFVVEDYEFANGGGVSEKRNGQYVTLEVLKNGLKISLTPEGKQKAQEEGLTEIDFWDFMEDIIVNSEYSYYPESPMGLTSAPVILDGYYYDDDGKLTDEGHKDSVVYWFPDYAIKSFAEILKEKGEVDFIKAAEFAKGGDVDKITFKKINQFGNETLYQATNGKLTIPYSITRVKDKKGTLLRMECTGTGLFETYSMEEVKNKIKGLFTAKEATKTSIDPKRLDTVLEHFVMAALWSTQNIDNEQEEMLDANYSQSDIDEKTIAAMRAKIEKFMTENADAIKESGQTDEQLGHDIWLSSNGHGAGFFDRGYDDEVEKKLMDAARKLGGMDLYVGDDGKIYAMGSEYKDGGDVDELSNVYYLVVDIDERDVYGATVYDSNDKAIWSVDAEGASDLIQDGFLKYKPDEDLDRLSKYLADNGIVPKYTNILSQEYYDKLRSDIDDENKVDVLEFKIPDWALSSLINGDESGMEEEDIEKLNKFVAKTVEQYGNANFSLASDDELDLGFCHSNDIDNLGSNCSKLLLIPSKEYKSGGDVKGIGGSWVNTGDTKTIKSTSKEQYFNKFKHSDSARFAKPAGFRYKGDNYTKPMLSEIKEEMAKPKRLREIYWEARPQRSDKTPFSNVMLAAGGSIDEEGRMYSDYYSTYISADDFEEAKEYYFKWMASNGTSPEIEKDATLNDIDGSELNHVLYHAEIKGYDIPANEEFKRGGKVDESIEFIGDYEIVKNNTNKETKLPYLVKFDNNIIVYKADTLEEAKQWANDRGGIEKFHKRKFATGGKISDYYIQVNDLFIDKKTFEVTTREGKNVYEGNSIEDATAWANGNYGSGGKVEGGHIFSWESNPENYDGYYLDKGRFSDNKYTLVGTKVTGGETSIGEFNTKKAAAAYLKTIGKELQKEDVVVVNSLDNTPAKTKVRINIATKLKPRYIQGIVANNYDDRITVWARKQIFTFPKPIDGFNFKTMVKYEDCGDIKNVIFIEEFEQILGRKPNFPYEYYQGRKYVKKLMGQYYKIVK